MQIHRKRIGFIVGQILLFIIICIPSIALQFIGSFQQGFFPNDSYISYPMLPNTISEVWATFFGLGAPLLAIFIIEIYTSYRDRYPRQKNTDIPIIFIQLYKVIGLLALSFASMLLIVQAGKKTVGSLRPFFLEVCEPANNIGDNFIPVANCTSSDVKLIAEARLSFPSGHSSCAFWGAAFATFYLQIRFPRCPSPMIKTFFQISVTVLGYYICLTRIQDNWHRPIDVIVGSLIGIATAALIFLIPLEEPENVEVDKLRISLIQQPTSNLVND